MANVRFIRYANNKARRTTASGTFPRVMNGLTGTYTGVAARVEDPAFPMDNVLTAGRKGNVWVAPDGSPSNYFDGTSLVLEVDIGSLQSISALGALAFTVAAGFPQGMLVDCIPGTTTYNNAGYVVQNTGNFVVNNAVRDGGVVLAGPVTARYWRFRFPSFSSGHGLSLAGVVLGSLITDLGFLYSGATETRVRPRALVESFDQTASLTFVGPEYVRWTLQYDNNDATLRQTFDDLYSDAQPFIFITPDNEWQECIWGTEEFAREHIWRPPDRYRMVVELRQLS